MSCIVDAMNNTKPFIGELIETVGNIATRVFWVTVALIGVGSIVMIAIYDLPAANAFAKIFGFVALLMVASVGVMIGSMKLLKLRGEWTTK